MIRDKKIEVRLTTEELNNLKNLSNICNVSISEIVRQAVKNNNSWGINKRKLALHVFNINTLANKICQTGATVEDLNLLIKETCELWPCLNH